jgi:hypothetical protein
MVDLMVPQKADSTALRKVAVSAVRKVHKLVGLSAGQMAQLLVGLSVRLTADLLVGRTVLHWVVVRAVPMVHY